VVRPSLSVWAAAITWTITVASIAAIMTTLFLPHTTPQHKTVTTTHTSR
jgi:hypothetical protein